MKKSIFTLNLFTCLLFIICCAFAQPNLTTKPIVKEFIRKTANEYKIDPSYIRSVLNEAHYNPEVIAKMEQPYETKPWFEYKQHFITSDRINNGVKYWQRSRKILDWEVSEYGVPANIIVAMLGIETKYGTEMGNFKTLDSLTTLAFYYPPKQDFFQKELAAFIVIAHTYKLNPEQIFGSYAGAIGQCQFMPRSYLAYAVDFQGSNDPNLFTDQADVVFSMGNYLRQNGWEPNEPIAVRAKIIGTTYKQILKTDNNQPLQPKLTLAQLRRYGVYPVSDEYNSDLKANLIELEGAAGKTEFWLTFNNFYVITRYNSSDLYALTALELANAINKIYLNQKFPLQSFLQEKKFL